MSEIGPEQIDPAQADLTEHDLAHLEKLYEEASETPGSDAMTWKPDDNQDRGEK
jgi:hypothetical protein